MSKSKKHFIVVMMVALAFVLSACGATAPKELTNVAEYEECVLILNNATTETTESGEKVVKVEATYTNNGSEPLYAYCSFAVRAFQHDKQLQEVSNINGDQSALIQEVKNGASISVTYVFILTDDSEVEVLVGEPTADQTTIAQQIYLKTEE